MRFIYSKTFVISFISLCILVGLLFLNSRGGLDQIKRFFLRLPGPVISLANNLGSGTSGFFSTLYNLKSLARENAELKVKVSDLQSQLAEAQVDVRDNQVLRSSLGFVKNNKLDLQPCEVISANVLNLTDTLVIDCGSEQGVEEGRAVMVEGHVVGKIIYAGKSTSTVLLATSSNFVLDARVSKSGQAAVVEGSFNSGILLDQLPQSSSLEKGWLIVTAGINSAVPKDLLIGEVGEIISVPNDLFKKASLITPVDFNNLEFVYVVK